MSDDYRINHPLYTQFPQLRNMAPVSWWPTLLRHPSSVNAELLMACLEYEFSATAMSNSSYTLTEGLWGHCDGDAFLALPVDHKRFLLAVAKQPWFQNVSLQRFLKNTELIRNIFKGQVFHAVTTLATLKVLDVMWFTEWRDVMDDETLRLMAIEAMERAFVLPQAQRRLAMKSCIQKSAQSLLGDTFFSMFMNRITMDEPDLILRHFGTLKSLMGESADRLATTALHRIGNIGVDLVTEYDAWEHYTGLPLIHRIPLLKTISFLTEDGSVIEAAYRLLGFTAQQYSNDADVDHVVKVILGNLQFDWAPAAFLAFIKGLRGNETLRSYENASSSSYIASQLCKETRYGRVAMTALQRAGWEAKDLDLEEGPQGKQLQVSYRHDGETIVFVIPIRLYRDYLGTFVLYPTTPPERSTFRRGNVRGYIAALPILTI